MCASTLALIVGAVALSELNRHDPWELLFLIAEATGALVGGLVASRRPHNPVGWFIAGHALCFSLGEFAHQYAIYGLLTEPGVLPLAGGVASLAYWVWFPGLVLVFALLPLYFPDGRLISRRWRPVTWFAFFVIMVVAGLTAIAPGDIETPGLPNPLGIESLRPFVETIDAVVIMLLLSVGLMSATSMVVRFRRSRGEERQQVKWFVYAVVLNVFSFPIANLFLHTHSPVLSAILHPIVLGSLWVAIAFAILKYRLYDIDLIINRTLVYGALSACVVGIYVLVVGYVGTLFRVEDNLLISLVAASLVAVLFQPLRERLQSAINRLMYGERDEPYTAVSRLGERLGSTLAPEAVLPAIVETVREALKLPYAAISLPRDGGNFEVAAASEGKPPGGPPAEPLILPLSYGGEIVGRLLLAPRAPGEGFSSADRRLLDGLARHAGVAVHGVRTMADLRRSRERLVLAREEERRRLRRDLHDELAPTLAALGLSAATVGELIPTDPKGAASANDKLRAAIRATVGDVRRLVYDLRPPALDELGLVEAVRERASRYGTGGKGFQMKVEAPDELPPLPAAVEVAAYRIVQEALTNVSRHAKARSCTVRLACPTGLTLEVEVTDDGVGLPDTPEGGVGLSSMRERATELGGECEIGRSSRATNGTRVFARLPLTRPEGRTV
jgi:signal transduction histidine kinase